MYSSTMKVEVELKYRAVPPEEEFEIIREAGRGLTTNPKSVSVRLVETDESPVIVLEFLMKNQGSIGFAMLLKTITHEFPMLSAF